MEDENENIDLGRFRNYKKQRPKLIIRYIIYTGVLFLLIIYGFKFIEELIPEKNQNEGIEVGVEVLDTTNTPQSAPNVAE